MTLKRILVFVAATMLAGGVSFSYANDKKNAKSTEEAAGWNDAEMAQPATETIDLNAYNLIREEGLQHSHVMDYAGGLADGIGPRLTGSPNMAKANAWTRDQLTKMGCVNAHLEDWGEFGMGWQQINTWVRMTAPDTAVFIAQAGPWSPATKGIVNAPAILVIIKDESDFEQYKGKLAGKIVFLGDLRQVKPVDKPLFFREDSAELSEIEKFPLKKADPADSFQAFLKRLELREKIGRFLAEEQAVAAVVPSRDGRNGGGSGGTIFDDTGAAFGWVVYRRAHAKT